jgi:hypothetical protein
MRIEQDSADMIPVYYRAQCIVGDYVYQVCSQNHKEKHFHTLYKAGTTIPVSQLRTLQLGSGRWAVDLSVTSGFSTPIPVPGA